MEKKSFAQYFKESAEGQGYVINILIRGTDESDFPKCHEQCQQLGKVEDTNKPLCKLFGGELKETEGDLAPIPLRNKKCIECTNRLI
jgi:hypothetical protein